MIRNINNIQNLSDLQQIINTDENAEFSNDYLIQALANLGQRIGLKGDSTTISNFSFRDLYSKNSIYDSEKYIGFINYSYDNKFGRYKFNIGVKEKSKILNKITIPIYLNDNSESKFDINDDIYFKRNFTLENDLIINNFEYYLENSFIRFKDGKIISVLFCKKINNSTNDENDCSIIYEIYDLNTSSFDSIYYISYLYTEYNIKDEEIHWYNLVECKKDKNSNTKYTVNVYTYNTSFDITEYYKNYFSNFDKDIFKNICSSKYILNTPNIREYIYNDDINSLIDIITDEKGIFYKSFSDYIKKGIEINFNEDTTTFSISKDNINNNNLLLNIQKYCQQDVWTIYDFIKCINNDIIYLEYDLLMYYNNYKYINTKELLYEKIILNMFEKIYYQYYNSIGEGECTLYIPLDYKFFFITNNNDIFNIFYSLDNYVYITSLESLTDVSLKEVLNNDSVLIFDNINSADNKIENYKFIFDYNKKYTNIINDINVELINTLPFIDNDNKWNINNVSTDIIAKGKTEKNSCFIIIVNDGNKIYSINNELNNDYNYYIEKYGYENYINDGISAQLPSLNDNNFSFFSSSIILYIDQSSENNTITSIWTIKEINDKYTWGIFKINDKQLSLYDIINIDDLKEQISNIIDKDNISEKLLLAKNNDLKNTGIYNKENDHLFIMHTLTGNTLTTQNIDTIKSFIGEKYSYNNILDTIDNELYTILGFSDSFSNNNIISSLKYLDQLYDNNLTSIKVKKYIPKYEISYKTVVEQVLKDLKIIDTVEYEFTVKDNVYFINLNVNTKTDEEKDTLRSLIVEKYKTVNTSTDANIISFEYTQTTNIQNEQFYLTNIGVWNDYTFNSNIPILNIKEAFLQDINILNRVNILSPDNSGHLFNAYFGTSFINENKNRLYLTTDTKNVNIGINTLSLSKKNKLDKFNEFEILFDNIYLSTKSNKPSITLYNTTNEDDKTEKINIDINVDEYNINANNNVSVVNTIQSNKLLFSTLTSTTKIDSTQKIESIGTRTSFNTQEQNIKSKYIPIITDVVDYQSLFFNYTNENGVISTDNYLCKFEENDIYTIIDPESISSANPDEGIIEYSVINSLTQDEIDKYKIIVDKKPYYYRPPFIMDVINRSYQLNQKIIPLYTDILSTPSTIDQNNHMVKLFGLSLTQLIIENFGVDESEIYKIYVNNELVHVHGFSENAVTHPTLILKNIEESSSSHRKNTLLTDYFINYINDKVKYDNIFDYDYDTLRQKCVLSIDFSDFECNREYVKSGIGSKNNERYREGKNDNDIKYNYKYDALLLIDGSKLLYKEYYNHTRGIRNRNTVYDDLIHLYLPDNTQYNISKLSRYYQFIINEQIRITQIPEVKDNEDSIVKYSYYITLNLDNPIFFDMNRLPNKVDNSSFWKPYKKIIRIGV